MDDEKVSYRAYEKFVKAGIKNVCVHKGLFPPSAEQTFPNLRTADWRPISGQVLARYASRAEKKAHARGAKSRCR
jgi:hypothetical protein